MTHCDDGYGYDDEELDEEINKYREKHNSTYNKYMYDENDDKWINKRRRDYHQRYL